MPSPSSSHQNGPSYLPNLPPELLRLILEYTFLRDMTFRFTGKWLVATRKVETIDGGECEVARQVCRLCEGKRLCRDGVRVQTSLFLVREEFAAEARGGFELTFVVFPAHEGGAE